MADDEGFANDLARFYELDKLLAPVETPAPHVGLLDKQAAEKPLETRESRIKVVQHTNADLRFVSPTEPGRYNVITQDSEQALVVLDYNSGYESPVCCPASRPEPKDVVVYHPGNRQALVVRAADVLAVYKPTEPPKTWNQDELAQGKKAEDAGVGDLGFLVTPGGTAVGPLKVRSTGDQGMAAERLHRWDLQEGVKERSSGDPGVYDSVIQVQFTPDKTGLLNNVFFAPKESRWLPLDLSKPAGPDVTPRKTTAIEHILTKQSGLVVIAQNDHGYTARGAINEHGSTLEALLEKIAEHDSQKSNGDINLWCTDDSTEVATKNVMQKLAWGVDPGQPRFSPDSVDTVLGVRVTRPQVSETRGQSFYQPKSLEEMLALGRQVTMAGAETGRKEVFDAGALARLLQAQDPQGLVQSYVSDLSKYGLDRLGRLLLLYYWRHKEFSEEYGERDMAELGDRLKAAFKALGRAIHVLSNRAPDDSYQNRGGSTNRFAGL